MTAVAAQPSSSSGREAVKRPITLWRETTTIIAIISGTAARPLSTALQNKARIGSIGDQSMSRPMKRRDDDDRIEAGGLPRLVLEPFLPAEHLGDGEGGRAGEDRHGEETGADDADREQAEGERPATGRSASAACAAELIWVMPWRCRVAAVGHDDRKRDEVGKGHADQRVDAHPAKLLHRAARRLPDRMLVRRVRDLLGFLRALPEEQIRADGRAEQGDDGQQRVAAEVAGQDEADRAPRTSRCARRGAPPT